MHTPTRDAALRSICMPRQIKYTGYPLHHIHARRAETNAPQKSRSTYQLPCSIYMHTFFDTFTCTVLRCRASSGLLDELHRRLAFFSHYGYSLGAGFGLVLGEQGGGAAAKLEQLHSLPAVLRLSEA